MPIAYCVAHRLHPRHRAVFIATFFDNEHVLHTHPGPSPAQLLVIVMEGYLLEVTTVRRLREKLFDIFVPTDEACILGEQRASNAVRSVEVP